MNDPYLYLYVHSFIHLFIYSGCGKCIGKNNMLYFKGFIGFLCFQCYFLIGSLIYFIINSTVANHMLPAGPPVI